jgi:hypothetical protein
MPVPTRLANDGWWLCDRLAAAPVLSLQAGSAAMADFSTLASDAGSARENASPVKPAIALVSSGSAEPDPALFPAAIVL